MGSLGGAEEGEGKRPRQVGEKDAGVQHLLNLRNPSKAAVNCVWESCQEALDALVLPCLLQRLDNIRHLNLIYPSEAKEGSGGSLHHLCPTQVEVEDKLTGQLQLLLLRERAK